MRYNGNAFTTSLFLIGIALAVFSSYYVLRGAYRMIAWTWTHGVITGTVVEEGIDDYIIHEQAEFVDPAGDTIQVISFSGVTYHEDARTGDVTILFNPQNPREATILQFRDYLVAFFLPFALFLIWLGWPFHPAPNSRRSIETRFGEQRNR
jgi:hypothetical protein